jgi:hypothetical protein
MNPQNFLTELKRRNVYRAAVAYGVVAWFLTQLTTQVFPFFEIPNSAVRFVVIALPVGFPIAMLLAWVYEFTPEGIVRTEDLRPAQARSIQRATGRILDFIIIGVLLMKDSALKLAERAVMLLPSAKDRMYGPGFEENLALIQTMFGANSEAISTLARLLQMPYYGGVYFETPVTPALLRLDPLWDPLRGDPAFEKLLRGKTALKYAPLSRAN